MSTRANQVEGLIVYSYMTCCLRSAIIELGSRNSKARSSNEENTLVRQFIESKINNTKSAFSSYIRRLECLKIIMVSEKIGFPVCADDFGTGHSGMEQLVELNFDVLKVDQVFIRNMFKNERYQTILNSIATMAKDLETKLVAEGIENDQEYQTLKKLGFDYGQGYFFGKPMSVEDVLKLTN